MISKNGLPMTDLIGQQHSLVGKWPMADRYIVLCPYIYIFLLAKYTFNISIAISSGPSDHGSLLTQGNGSHANPDSIVVMVCTMML